jgi:hypothetical protein
MQQMVKFLIAALLLFKASAGFAQGSFQDLNFESADVPASSGYEPYGTFVPIASALPGWTAFVGNQQVSQVAYNSPTAGTATISLIGPNWNTDDVDQYGVGIIDGNYTLDLQGGANPNNIALIEPVSIEQFGAVPSTAESLQFKALTSLPSLSVSFAGSALNLVALSSGVGPNGIPYNLYGANISAYAGQAGELEFTSGNETYPTICLLDDITFSPNAVTPEPSTLALGIVGASVIWLRLRQETSRSTHTFDKS